MSDRNLAGSDLVFDITDLSVYYGSFRRSET